ncbi:MAG: (deoxy)nucleoside triphosphate pyrophosphohydrolase [Bacteroidetes bacterium]|nr:(deoxy)nucleoside triphosphate pyrophosphohydrolase [Bacteroidota bacterium]
MKHIKVVAAVIQKGDEFLCVQRNYSKYDYISFKYEFPGGKVEENETEEEALKREISEELSLIINIKSHFITVNHVYPDFEITMATYLCSCQNNELVLTEHVDFKWLTKDKLSELDWAAADVPIVEKLKQN